MGLQRVESADWTGHLGKMLADKLLSCDEALPKDIAGHLDMNNNESTFEAS